MVTDALTIAASTRADLCGAEVVYRAGSKSAVIRAIPTQPAYSSDEDPTAVSYQAVDWLIIAANLIVGGSQVEPQPGHQIEQTIGGVKQVFVVEPDAGDHCWVPHDSYGIEIRVHTKRVQ